MSDENGLNSVGGAVLVSSLAPFFRHAWRGVVVVAVGVCRRPLLVARFLSCLPRRPWPRGFSCGRRLVSALLAPCVPSRVGAFLRSSVVLSACLSRFALSSYRSAPRFFDKWGGAGGLRLGRGSSWVAAACCLPWRGRECGVAVPIGGAARCRRVDGVGYRRDFRRLCCLPLVALSGWRVSLVAVPSRCLLVRFVLVVCRHVVFSLLPAVVVPLFASFSSSWVVMGCSPSGVVVRGSFSSSVVGCPPSLSCLPSVVVIGRVRPVSVSPAVSRLVARCGPSFLLALVLVVVRLLGVFAFSLSPAGVLFPVVFVLFRFAPELSISSGIMRFNCGLSSAMSSVCCLLRSSRRSLRPGVARSIAPSCLSVGRGGWRGVFSVSCGPLLGAGGPVMSLRGVRASCGLSSRAARCLVVSSIGAACSPWRGCLVLSVCLLPVSVSCGGGDGWSWLVCSCFRPRGSCGFPLRVRLSGWSAASCGAARRRLVVCLASVGAGASCACVPLVLRYAFRPVPRVEGRGDVFRVSCSLSFLLIRR